MMNRLTLSLIAVALCALVLACSSEAPKPAAPAAEPAAAAAAAAPEPAVQGKAFTCPMTECQEVKDQPGKCSKCGMDLVEVDRAALSYVCDMCSVSEKAPGKCAKCGMDLALRVAKAELPPGTQAPVPAPVPEQ